MEMTLVVKAGTSTDGRPAFEEVLVDSADGGEYLLLRSPGLVQGLAAGDRFVLEADRSVRVTRRGWNLCVQIYSNDSLDALERQLEQPLLRLGGRLDGKTANLLVYTVPAKAGFSAVESILQEHVTSSSGAEWYFGNVYDERDGVTPLNWWTEIDQ